MNNAKVWTRLTDALSALKTIRSRINTTIFPHRHIERNDAKAQKRNVTGIKASRQKLHQSSHYVISLKQPLGASNIFIDCKRQKICSYPADLHLKFSPKHAKSPCWTGAFSGLIVLLNLFSSFGSGRRIWTLTNGVRVRCATFTLARYIRKQKPYSGHYTVIFFCCQ